MIWLLILFINGVQITSATQYPTLRACGEAGDDVLEALASSNHTLSEAYYWCRRTP